MGKNQKSISERLKSKKTYQGQHKVLSEWCENWHKDQITTINQIYDALREHRYGDANVYLTHLLTMTDKRFMALDNIVNIVSNPDRQLKDRETVGVKGKSINVTGKSTKSEIEDITCSGNAKSQEELIKSYTLDRKPNINIREIKEIDIDEIVKSYNAGFSVEMLGINYGVSSQKIIKILVTANVYSSEIYDKVKELREAGKSDWEIMDLVDLSRKMLNVYTPYKKGVYKLKNPSKNAMIIRKYREKSDNLD